MIVAAPAMAQGWDWDNRHDRNWNDKDWDDRDRHDGDRGHGDRDDKDHNWWSSYTFCNWYPSWWGWRLWCFNPWFGWWLAW
jgi:hypothetical protein